MPARRKLTLSEEQRCALVHMRDSDSHPYLRERAAALLKIADGMSAERVAREGLLRKRHPENVRIWLDRYLAEGIAGLHIRAGRGRKPVFSPSTPHGAERTG